MNRPVILVALLSSLSSLSTGCGDNPLLSEWDTPFAVPPFEKIRVEHYVPAFKAAMAQHKAEIEAIVGNPEPPTFANTIAALDTAGSLLSRVASVFGALNAAMVTDEMQATAKTLSPLRTKHRDDINLNADLFARVKAVYEKRAELKLTGEQARLLKLSYESFVRGGADLPPAKKAEFRKLNKELAMLSLRFGENVLKETNKFEMLLEDKADLAGLPAGVVQAAAEAAAKRGHTGKWLFTTHKPSMLPFLRNSQRRELRERIYKAYTNRGDHDDELDNKAILAKMAALRVTRANLLGYKTHAHFVLERNMAQEPGRVYGFLKRLWEPAMAAARREVAQMQKLITAAGEDFELQPWDWWYYSEKVKKAHYDLDESQLRPYFKLENVRDGAFMVATKLWGLTFHERTDLPKYNEEVKVFEVKNRDGSHRGILYTDYFPRATKRGGAWMNSLRKQAMQRDAAGKSTLLTPVITNNGNFTRPTGGTPSLLSFEEVATLFHEFGHALHGLFSECNYEGLSGTSVPRDFVELPSQIMENWASHPEVLALYARHYETGEPIPKALVDKIVKARQFNQGFIRGEYLAASFLDMDWHTLEKAVEHDANEFENAAMQRIGLIPEIISRYRSTYFRHIFAGGYSSGYYSYIWAEVLDADAFQAFEERGIFDQGTAEAFRKHVLSRGNADEPMNLYKQFRGREPKVEALLARVGFK
ncbi:MAG: M3 family metallopeptidase [Planctomycetota bacterium]|jgi:peptidyl-dipeptidase Dcp